MTHPPVRQATPDDIPELVRVINAAYRVEEFFIHGERTSAAELVDRMARPGCALLVVPTPDGSGLAAAVFLEHRAAVTHFGMLSVDPARQGEGLARHLLAGVEAHAHETGSGTLELEMVNLRRELPSFYARHGFVVTGEAPFHSPAKLKQPAHMVVMRKPLSG